MAAAVIEFVQPLESITCGECGITFAVPDKFISSRREDGKSFYCPNGHGRAFLKSEVDRLKEELAAEKRRREWAEQQKDTARRAEAIARGKLRAQSERVANGVCPCCRRTFQNLRRHMETKRYVPAGPERPQFVDLTCAACGHAMKLDEAHTVLADALLDEICGSLDYPQFVDGRAPEAILRAFDVVVEDALARARSQVCSAPGCDEPVSKKSSVLAWKCEEHLGIGSCWRMGCLNPVEDGRVGCAEHDALDAEDEE